MASVPNMRLGPTARPGVSDQPGDQVEGDGFAQLLSTTKASPGESEPQPQDAAAASEEKPAIGGESDTPIAQAEAILSLVALQAAPATVAKMDAVTQPMAVASDGKPGATTALAPPAAAPAGAGVLAAETALDPAALSAVPATPTAPTVVAAAVAPASAMPVSASPTHAAPTPSASIPGHHAPAEQPVPVAGVPPLGSGTAEQAGPSAGQPSTAPTASAATPAIATAASTAKAGLGTGGVPLVAMQTDGSDSATAARIATLGKVKTGTIDPAIAAASTPAVAPGRGTRESARQPSLNVAAPKGDGVPVQAASVPTAAPVIPPFSPIPLIEPAAAAAVAPAAPAAVSASEAMIERQLDLAADGEWLDQLARDIASTGGADGKMRFRLDPEHLGSLKVELAQSERGTSIRLTVETEAARAILADAQPRLAAEARAQGVRIADSHVDLAGGQAGDPRRHETDRRGSPLRTAREASSQAEPERQLRTGSDRYA